MWEPSSGLSITLRDSIPSMNSHTPVSDPHFHHIRILNTMVWKCRLQRYTYQSLFFKVKISRVTHRWYSIFKWRTQEHANSKPPRRMSVKKRFLIHHDKNSRWKFCVTVLTAQWLKLELRFHIPCHLRSIITLSSPKQKKTGYPPSKAGVLAFQRKWYLQKHTRVLC